MMIDWVAVAFNTLWIAGLALVLAALSYYYWVAREENVPVLLTYRQPAFLRFVYLGLILIGLGLAGTSPSLVETILAIVLIGLSAYGLLQLVQQTRKDRL
jgi:hypothetical protein